MLDGRSWNDLFLNFRIKTRNGSELRRRMRVFGHRVWVYAATLSHSMLYLTACYFSRQTTKRDAVFLRSAESNYWHWMMDCVPRYRLLKAARVDTSDAILLIEHRNLPYQMETLKALGFPDEAVLLPDAHTHIEADTLIVPNYVIPGSDAGDDYLLAGESRVPARDIFAEERY